MSKVIAFSLYGSDPKYNVGAVENARLAKRYYPSWRVHVWLGAVPNRGMIGMTLHQAGAIVHIPPANIINGMFWRFLAHDLPDVERYLCRDVDSRFSEREVKAVNEWIAAGTQLHVCRDHIYHNQPIMGCSWGWLKMPGDFNMAKEAKPWADNTAYGRDQEFLAAVVWKKARSKTVHDSCGTFDGTRNWPPDGPGFVGEYCYETGAHNEEHRRMRLEHLRK